MEAFEQVPGNPPESAVDQLPAGLVVDPIARIEADGRLVPANEAAKRWLRENGGVMASLPLGADERQHLGEGAAVHVRDAAGRWCRLQCRDEGGQRWLVVRDVDAEERNQALSSASVRGRQLAGSVARLLHDLNNRLAAMLALSAELGEPNESRRDLESATRAGSRVLRVLARQLSGATPQRRRVSLHDLVCDAVALVHKEYEVAGGVIDVDEVPLDVHVRGDELQLTQAVMAGLSAFREGGAVQVAVRVLREDAALAGGRPRPCVRLCLRASPVHADVRDAIADVVGMREGVTCRIANAASSLEPLAHAVLAIQHGGGVLQAETDADGMRLDYILPTVG